MSRSDRPRASSASATSAVATRGGTAPSASHRPGSPTQGTRTKPVPTTSSSVTVLVSGTRFASPLRCNRPSSSTSTRRCRRRRPSWSGSWTSRTRPSESSGECPGVERRAATTSPRRRAGAIDSLATVVTAAPRAVGRTAHSARATIVQARVRATVAATTRGRSRRQGLPAGVGGTSREPRRERGRVRVRARGRSRGAASADGIGWAGTGAPRVSGQGCGCGAVRVGGAGAGAGRTGAAGAAVPVGWTAAPRTGQTLWASKTKSALTVVSCVELSAVAGRSQLNL